MDNFNTKNIVNFFGTCIVLLLVLVMYLLVKVENISIPAPQANVNIPPASIPFHSTSSYGDGGYWIYDQNNARVIFLRYDSEQNKIIQMEKYVNE